MMKDIFYLAHWARNRCDVLKFYCYLKRTTILQLKLIPILFSFCFVGNRGRNEHYPTFVNTHLCSFLFAYTMSYLSHLIAGRSIYYIA
jgi:hypothetical protein